MGGWVQQIGEEETVHEGDEGKGHSIYFALSKQPVCGWRGLHWALACSPLCCLLALPYRARASMPRLPPAPANTPDPHHRPCPCPCCCAHRYVDPVLPLKRYDWVESYCRLLQQDVACGLFAGEGFVGCGRLSCGWFALLTHVHLLCIAADYGSSPHDPDVSTGGAAGGHFLAGCAWLTRSCFWKDFWQD